MSTVSTPAIYTELIGQILGFIPLSGNPVSGSLGSRLYAVQAPDTPTFPYGVMRLTNSETSPSDQSTGNDMMKVTLEVLLYARPRSQQMVLEIIADKVDQAMMNFNDPASGILFMRGRQRDTVSPINVDPVDREVVTILLRYPITMWPQYLTQYSGN